MKSVVDALTPLVLEASPVPLSTELSWLIFSNGTPDADDNLIFFGYEPGNEEPSLVAKVPRLPSNGPVLRAEFARLAELWSSLGTDAHRYLPRPIALVEPGGYPAMILSYAPGESLLHCVKQRFWRSPSRIPGLAAPAARALRRVHDSAAIPLEQGKADRTIATSVREIEERIALFRELHAPSGAEGDALSALAASCVPTGATHKTLIQGDFWHGNLIRNPGAAAGDAFTFIDWQFARWSADVSLDVYLFLLAGALFAAPHRTPAVQARGAVRALRLWRAHVIPSYLDAYGPANSFALLPARAGMLACCVDKAVRNVLAFGRFQTDDEVWRLLFGELAGVPESDPLFAGI